MGKPLFGGPEEKIEEGVEGKSPVFHSSGEGDPAKGISQSLMSCTKAGN